MGPTGYTAGVLPAEAPPLPPDTAARWRDLISGRMGMDIRETGWPDRDHYLRRRLWSRMRALSITSYEAYLEWVGGAADGEWRALMELLVNRQSGFFRHLPSFAALTERVLPALIRQRRGSADAAPIGVWSVGCAAGQEAYSLAMAHVLTAERLGADPCGARVTGIDISPAALEKARRGAYAPFEVRGLDEAWRRRFMRREPLDGRGGYRHVVRESIRRRVAFAEGAVAARDGAGPLDPEPPSPPPDVIFCQNLLIYFRYPDRARVVAGLIARLRPGGHLFLGPGELAGDRFAGARCAPYPDTLCFIRLEEAKHVPIP